MISTASSSRSVYRKKKAHSGKFSTDSLTYRIGREEKNKQKERKRGGEGEKVKASVIHKVVRMRRTGIKDSDMAGNEIDKKGHS